MAPSDGWALLAVSKGEAPLLLTSAGRRPAVVVGWLCERKSSCRAMQGRGRLDKLRCLLRACRPLTHSPLAAQSPLCVRLGSLTRVGVTEQTTGLWLSYHARVPVPLHRSFAAGASGGATGGATGGGATGGATDGATGDEAARVAGEAFVEKLRDMMTPEQRAVVERPLNTQVVRSVSSVWEVAAALCKPAGATLAEWKHSNDGVRCALACVGLVLVPNTVGEPLRQTDGSLYYGYRKVEVWRAGVRSASKRLDNLLKGDSGLSTVEERAAVNERVSLLAKARLLAQGDNTQEIHAANLAAFLTLVGLSDVLRFERTSGATLARVASYACTKVGAIDAAHLGFRVKTVTEDRTYGRLMFSFSPKEMKDCLKNGVCVLLIGVDAANRPSVAYLLHGPKALEALNRIPESSCDTPFAPRLHPKRTLPPDGLPSLLQPVRYELDSRSGRASVSSDLLAALDGHDRLL